VLSVRLVGFDLCPFAGKAALAHPCASRHQHIHVHWPLSQAPRLRILRRQFLRQPDFGGALSWGACRDARSCRHEQRKPSQCIPPRHPISDPVYRNLMRLWKTLCGESSLPGNIGVIGGFIFEQGEGVTAACEVVANIDAVFAGKPAPTGTSASEITGGNSSDCTASDKHRFVGCAVRSKLLTTFRCCMPIRFLTPMTEIACACGSGHCIGTCRCHRHPGFGNRRRQPLSLSGVGYRRRRLLMQTTSEPE
jgi:hypothetical protein